MSLPFYSRSSPVLYSKLFYRLKFRLHLFNIEAYRRSIFCEKIKEVLFDVTSIGTKPQFSLRILVKTSCTNFYPPHSPIDFGYETWWQKDGRDISFTRSLCTKCTIIRGIVYWTGLKTGCLLRWFPDVRGSKHFCNVAELLSDYTPEHPRRHSSSFMPPWEPEISFPFPTCKPNNVPVVFFYGCETWSVTLTEERGLNREPPEYCQKH